MTGHRDKLLHEGVSTTFGLIEKCVTANLKALRTDEEMGCVGNSWQNLGISWAFD